MCPVSESAVENLTSRLLLPPDRVSTRFYPRPRPHRMLVQGLGFFILSANHGRLLGLGFPCECLNLYRKSIALANRAVILCWWIVSHGHQIGFIVRCKGPVISGLSCNIADKMVGSRKISFMNTAIGGTTDLSIGFSSTAYCVDNAKSY